MLILYLLGIILFAFAPIIICIILAKKTVDSHPEEDNPDYWDEIEDTNTAAYILENIL